MSLKNRILMYYKKNPFWISGGEIEKLSMEVGKKASNASRRLRELHEAGILERREVNGYVEYRYIPKEDPKKFWSPSMLDVQMAEIESARKETKETKIIQGALV
jgi:predicted transcriptional regulator